MNDYLNGELGRLRYEEIIGECASWRSLMGLKADKRPIPELLILKMADFMINRGTRMKENLEEHNHYQLPKGA